MSQSAREILETLLGHLGFAFEIEEIAGEAGVTLQVRAEEKDRLIGRDGETLDDLQYLLNRILQAQDPASSKVQVDVERFREARNERLLQRVRKVADLVRQTGTPFHLDPMNAYERRLVHHAFRDDPEVSATSPADDARIKRITLRKRETSI